MQPAKGSVWKINVIGINDKSCLSGDNWSTVARDQDVRMLGNYSQVFSAWYWDFNESPSQDVPNAQHLLEGNLN